MSTEKTYDAMPETSAEPDPGATAFAASSRRAAENAPVRRRTARSQLHRLAAFHSLPEALRDNEYITKYYRVNYSGRQTIKSLFGVHNETANIWSHFLGFMLFVALTFATIYAQPAPVALGTQKLLQLEQLVVSAGRSGWQEVLRAERSVGEGLWLLSAHLREGGWEGLLEDLRTLEERVMAYGSDGLRGVEGRYARLVASLVDADWPTQRWPIYVFTAGAMTCLFTSSFCHLFGCCSWHFAKTIWKYDYAGIVVLIVTSFVPPVYYGFLCQPVLRNFYLISTVSLGAFTAAVTLLPFFQTTRFRPFRASLFAGLGLWGIVPAMHTLWLYGAAREVQRFFVLDMLMGADYLLGAAIYALRVPERWKPGAFDLWFSSHQLFHLCVVSAALIHYAGVHILLDWRDATGGCAAL